MTRFTTVQQLSDHIDIPEKRVRRWLRQGFPEMAPGKGGRWTLTPGMIGFVMNRAGRTQ